VLVSRSSSSPVVAHVHKQKHSLRLLDKESLHFLL
jgi:hypothetical protein